MPPLQFEDDAPPKRKRTKTKNQLELEAAVKPTNPVPHDPSAPPRSQLPPPPVATPDVDHSVTLPPAQIGHDRPPTSTLNIPSELLQQLIPFLLQSGTIPSVHLSILFQCKTVQPLPQPSTSLPSSTSTCPKISLAGLVVLD